MGGGCSGRERVERERGEKGGEVLVLVLVLVVLKDRCSQ